MPILCKHICCGIVLMWKISNWLKPVFLECKPKYHHGKFPESDSVVFKTTWNCGIYFCFQIVMKFSMCSSVLFPSKIEWSWVPARDDSWKQGHWVDLTQPNQTYICIRCLFQIQGTIGNEFYWNQISIPSYLKMLQNIHRSMESWKMHIMLGGWELPNMGTFSTLYSCFGFSLSSPRPLQLGPLLLHLRTWRGMQIKSPIYNQIRSDQITRKKMINIKGEVSWVTFSCFKKLTCELTFQLLTFGS